MNSIKEIDIGPRKQKKKLSKKQMYKELLSSKTKLKDLIKTKRFNYLNMIPTKKDYSTPKTESITKSLTPEPEPKPKPKARVPTHSPKPKSIIKKKKRGSKIKGNTNSRLFYKK